MKSDYKEDREYSDDWYGEMCRILMTQLPKIIIIKPASYNRDVKQATDYIIKAKPGTCIAARIRRPGYNKSFGGITIRSYRPNGYPTERDKLKNPENGSMYFYAWAKNEYEFENWVLIDLKQTRKKGILDKTREEIPNPDGTRFIEIEIEEFEENDCIISKQDNGIPF